MFKRFVNPALSGSLCLVFLIFLIRQLSIPAYAQAQPQGSSAPAPKQIVLLYSYGDGIPAYQQATRAFLSIMREGGVSANNLFFEYLDLERNKDAGHYKNLTALFRHKYEGKKIDLVVTVHTQALRFILNEGKDLFPGTPVLAYLAPETIETAGTGRRFLLLPMRMDFGGTLELALRLFPETKRVVFINGTGEGEKRLESEARGIFEQWRDKLQFEYTGDLSLEEMLQRIANLPPRTIIFYSNVFRDKTGRTFVPKTVAGRIAKAANAPVFGTYNTILGMGIIGGSVFDFEAEGARAGSLALDILGGKLTLTKPLTILAASRTPMFDWKELKRWGVKDKSLPPESIFLNRPGTVWGEYKRFILGGMALFLAQTFLIIGLVAQSRKKKRAEKSLRQKTEELDRFFEVTLDLFCIANTDGYFLRLNPSALRILGYSSEELMANPLYDFVHPDDLDKTREVMGFLASQQDLSSFENRYRCKDGTYRWLEWSSATVGNLVYAAARDITERKQAEQALQEHERVLSQNQDDLRELTGRLITAQEEERRHLARELHDDLTQRLAVLSIDAENLEQQLMDSPDPVKEKLKDIKNQTVKISWDIHNLARQLHPSILDDLGLVRAVESECAAFLKREGVNIVFRNENVPDILEKDISLTLYRIVQEGLRNISKHACADHVSIFLQCLDHEILLSIQDDGIGFDMAKAKVTPGIGLSSLRERARLIHGDLSIKAAPGEGTVITVRAPLNSR